MAGMSTVSLANRVKVAVRCRPPFEEEGTASAVKIPSSPSAGKYPNSMLLEVGDKAREFQFDVVFGPETTNSAVYDVVAGPVVDGVMKGVNGTVLAYGQTGSGKTHSLGILTRVAGESGIIPRSLSHVFGYIAQANAQNASATASGAEKGTKYSVTLSFLQLYLDTVQDLLTPTNPSQPAPPGERRVSLHGQSDASMLNVSSASSWAGGVNSSMVSGHGAHGGRNSSGGGTQQTAPSYGGLTTLAVREDPARGFYVEGASEFSVNSFQEAVQLLNYGLENRVLGATRMNATSSRSHTMLLVKVEAKQRVSLNSLVGGDEDDASGAAASGVITRKSQLVLCDLAGSERVRRTSSRGARLEEARAINASLHTLGQVISALAVISQQSSGPNASSAARVHVPWRDSKLTRLLYGNLGGNANTYLLATMGPAAKNASETLSTLQFASRCMRVSANPVASLATSQVDYAHLCARLQARLAGLEGVHAAELASLARRYEDALADCKAQLESSNQRALDAEAALSKAHAASLVPSQRSPLGNGSQTDRSLDLVNVSLTEEAALDASKGARPAALKAAYSELCSAYDASAQAVLHNQARFARAQKAWAAAIQRAKVEEGAASEARDAMELHDPMSLSKSGASAAAGGDGTHPPGLAVPVPDPSTFGPHLGQEYRSAAAAMQAVHSQHQSNSVGRPAGSEGGAGAMPDSGRSRSLLLPPSVPSGASSDGATAVTHPPFESFSSVSGLVSYCSKLAACTVENCQRLDELIAVKDMRFDEVKRHLAAAEAAVRVRDEDVQNQRYVLKYLVDTTAQLREDLSHARQAAISTSVGGKGSRGSAGVPTPTNTSSFTPDGLTGSDTGSKRPRQRSALHLEGSESARGAVPTLMATLSPIGSPVRALSSPDGSPNSVASAPSASAVRFMAAPQTVQERYPLSVSSSSSSSAAEARPGGEGSTLGQGRRGDSLPVIAAKLDLDMEMQLPKNPSSLRHGLTEASIPPAAAAVPAGRSGATHGPVPGRRAEQQEDDLVLDDDEEEAAEADDLDLDDSDFRAVALSPPASALGASMRFKTPTLGPTNEPQQLPVSVLEPHTAHHTQTANTAQVAPEEEEEDGTDQLSSMAEDSGEDETAAPTAAVAVSEPAPGSQLPKPAGKMQRADVGASRAAQPEPQQAKGSLDPWKLSPSPSAVTAKGAVPVAVSDIMQTVHAGGHATSTLNAATLGKPPRPPMAPRTSVMLSNADYGDGGDGSSLDPLSHGAAELGDGDDEIEQIIAHRIVAGPGGQPKMLYKVRWKGADPSEDEWFPREDLAADFPAQVASYEKGLKAS